MTAAETELKKLEADLVPLTKRIDDLRQIVKRERSIEFIVVNGITLGSVEATSMPDRPHFGTIDVFMDWLKKRTKQKRWAEWNGWIYHTSDLINGDLRPTPARLEDVPN